MDSDSRDQPDEPLSIPDGWTILDVLSDDAAGQRLLVRCGEGESVQLIEPPEDAQSSLRYRERFKHKANRARTVRHDRLVPTLGFVEDAGKLFLAEPNAEGVCLAELMRKEGALPLDAVLDVGLDIARGLEALHRAGLVHGGVRPEAMLVTDEAACLRACGLEPPKGDRTVEPEFASPEHLSDDRSLRPQSDFFSLGSTLFAAVVGRAPFVGDTPDRVADAVREGRPTFPAPDEPPLPANVQAFFAKLLAAEPDQRPLSAQEVIDDIQALRRGETIARVTALPPRAPAADIPAPKRRLARVVLAAAAVIAAAWLIWPRGEDGAPPALSGPAPTSRPAATTPPVASVTTLPAQTTAPARQPTRGELAADAYAEAVKYARTYPTNFDEIVRRFERIARAYAGTKAALNAEQKAADYRLKKQGAKRADFADVQAEADKLAAGQKFGAAIAALNKHEVLHTTADGQIAPKLRDAIRRQISFVRAKAAEAFKTDADAAARAVKAERYQEAIRIYEHIVAVYGLDEYALRARKELDILRPLLAQQDKVAAQRLTAQLKAAYDETAVAVRAKVKAFDLEGAAADSEKLVRALRGSVLEPDAARHLAHLKLLLALKRRVIARINTAKPKLKSESLGLGVAAATVEAADAAGLRLATAAGIETRPWTKLSDWEKYSVALKASDPNSADDRTALGLLSLEQGHLARALRDLEHARRLGADVADLVARARTAPVADPKPADPRPEQMLVAARRLVEKQQWLDALVLLIPLKEKHAKANYAIRRKLDEINARLAACNRALARADIERDIASGAETALLAGGIDGWETRGKGWTFKDGRVSCANAAEHDVEMLAAAKPTPAYRLSVRCRVLAGNGLLVRVASDGDQHYDFWLGLGDQAKTGLWYSAGGKVRRSAPIAFRALEGEWVVLRATVTSRHVRVACAGKTCRLVNQLAAGGKRSYGFLARQKSKVEFEDLRLRILREQ